MFGQIAKLWTIVGAVLRLDYREAPEMSFLEAFNRHSIEMSKTVKNKHVK